jgi:hypothetical protein
MDWLFGERFFVPAACCAPVAVRQKLTASLLKLRQVLLVKCKDRDAGQHEAAIDPMQQDTYV